MPLEKAALTVTVSQLPGVDSALHFSISSADSLMYLSDPFKYPNLQDTLASDRVTQHRHACVEEGKLWGKDRRKHSIIYRKLYNLGLKNQNSQFREEINTRGRMEYF